MSESTYSATGPRPLGELLVEEGALTADELARALEHGRRRGQKLGQALLELGLVDEAALSRALGRQGRLYSIELTPAIVDPACAQQLEERLCRERRCVAINRIAGVTTVAMEDPSDHETLEEIARRLGTAVLAVHADPRRIEASLEAAFAVRLDDDGENGAAHELGAELAHELRFPAGIEEAEQFAEEEGLQGPVSDLIHALLGEAIESRASALHFEPRERRFVVRLRVDGALHERLSLARSWARPCIARLKLLCELDVAWSDQPQEGCARGVFRGEEVTLCAATAPTAHGESLVLRIEGRRSERRSLTELGAEPDDEALLRELAAARAGLLVVAGPRGSGRRTTLRALLGALDRQGRKVVAIERHPLPAPEGTAVIALDERRELGRAEALRAVLAQDVDVLVLDALGDGECAALAVRAALEGRLVLAATSAADTGAALGRFEALGVDGRLVAEALLGVVAQRLLRRPCATCAPAERPPSDDDAGHDAGDAGCRECRSSGMRGRALVLEAALATDELRTALRRGDDPRALRTAALASAPRSLRAAGLLRTSRGETTLSEVLAHTPEDPS